MSVATMNNVIAPVAAGGMRGQQCGYRRKSNIAFINEGGRRVVGCYFYQFFHSFGNLTVNSPFNYSSAFQFNVNTRQ